MKRVNGTHWLLLALLSALAVPVPLFAQSCAMCYQSAAKSGPQAIQALKSGILILVFPPLFIVGAITLLAYHKRDQFNDTQ